ncbi:YbbR-like domain-containing protein [Streptococcus macacae]|uniref:YbbR-like protein n=1 Tax=Streptococcus macacae NCTC 11558 TaxID=764298 RepID=G5JVK9_9STRE|nr:CdaR family protein [Streptococcus macacae]EHJ52897.1 YbbR-like protein [Streptococcus macacae NCTC 11558]SUN78678.1 YbbR-like signal peptide containing protein [Streptococcus macacae NCTC 11558]
MVRRIFTKKIGLIIVSVFFAVLLFLTANSVNYGSKNQPKGLLQTYSHTLENVPIDIKYDSDKFFISGYSYDTEVYLTSTNRVKLDSEINSDTRNFKVVADLTKATEGTRKFPLEVKNLPDGVTAETSPANITVTVGKKQTKTFPVEGQVSANQLAGGYQLKNIKTGVSEVKVTSDEATISQIDHVIAALPDNKILSENYSGSVTLQAVSSNGKILPSIINPTKTQLNVEVAELSKTVPIVVELTGQMKDNVSDIRYELDTKGAVVFGKQEDLDKINSIKVKVDISDVSKDTTKTVNLSAGNHLKVSPNKVSVKLTAKKK